MEQRKYSIKEIQRIMRISPNSLQELLQDDLIHINIEIVTLPNGEKESYLDRASFERLMFLKHIKFGHSASPEEIVEQLCVPSLQDLVFKGEKGSSIEDLLEKILHEMFKLQSALNEIALKYDEMNRELNHVRVENAILKEQAAKLRSAGKEECHEAEKQSENNRVIVESHKLH